MIKRLDVNDVTDNERNLCCYLFFNIMRMNKGIDKHVLINLSSIYLSYYNATTYKYANSCVYTLYSYFYKTRLLD